MKNPIVQPATLCYQDSLSRKYPYGGPFWSKLNKIFSLLIELFALAVYFILLYIYILLPFVAPFFRYLPWIFGTSYKLFFLQCTDYFWHPFWIIFFVLSELFLVTLHQLFLATVNLISGSVMHCVTLTCSSRHYENMEESMRTRIAQIAPNLIKEIDRIAQIVRTNEPSINFSSQQQQKWESLGVLYSVRQLSWIFFWRLYISTGNYYYCY